MYRWNATIAAVIAVNKTCCAAFNRFNRVNPLFVCGDQKPVAYSTIGRTKDRYGRALADRSHDERFLWRIPKTLGTLQLPTQRTCYIDAKALLVAGTVELRITKGVTKLGRRILQSDGHDETFCGSNFHLPCLGPLLQLIEVSREGKMVAYGIIRTVKNTVVGEELNTRCGVGR